MGKFINPFTDFGFKHIFGREMDKDILIEFRKAEATEDEGVVADDIEDIDYDGDHHRVDGLVGTAQGGGEGEG